MQTSFLASLLDVYTWCYFFNSLVSLHPFSSNLSKFVSFLSWHCLQYCSTTKLPCWLGPCTNLLPTIISICSCLSETMADRRLSFLVFTHQIIFVSESEQLLFWNCFLLIYAGGMLFIWKDLAFTVYFAFYFYIFLPFLLFDKNKVYLVCMFT